VTTVSPSPAASTAVGETRPAEGHATNLAKRVAVGVVAIPIILLLCMAGGAYFFAFIALASAVALREFYALAENKGARPLIIVGLAGGFSVNLAFFAASPRIPPQDVLLAFVMIAAVVELFHNERSPILNLSTTLFGVCYVSLFFGTLIGIRQMFELDTFPVARYFPGSVAGESVATQIHHWGGAMTIALFAMIWICDSAAFHVGHAVGTHKLFPRVSPNKSWEGAIAGFVAAILATLLAQRYFLPFLPVTGALFIGAVVGTIGQLGDLVESLLKRDAGVKDSSTLIPGHGGAFDRFDSILLVAPCVYLYLGYLLRG
jgi:phosphatidate cytidylyltransferase